MLVEICLEGIESVAAAAQGGANRIELCEHLACGGVTPSAGMIRAALDVFHGPVHVLLRPRPGSFRYTPRELDVLRRDVEFCRTSGVSGVVLGALLADGTIDLPATRSFVELARPLSVTFHRAFDETPDPDAALDSLLELGVDRILTSGGTARAIHSLPRLASWQTRAGHRLTILPGGGCTAQDLPSFSSSGLREAHFGSAAQRDGLTRADLVRQLVDTARALNTAETPPSSS